ncbi:Protein CASP, partial [Bulinus truncatus]
IAQLVEDVQRLQASLNKLRESTSEQVARLEEELSCKNMAFRALEEKLRTQEDYEEVKRELRVLKSIEFANAYIGPEEGNKSLEVLLLEKNKSLQTEGTHLKVVNAGLTGKCLKKVTVVWYRFELYRALLAFKNLKSIAV